MRLLLRRPLERALLVGFFLLLPLLLLFKIYRSIDFPPDFVVEHPYFHYDLDSLEPRNDPQTCVLPRVHPFHPSVWQYLTAPRDIVCRSRRPALTYVDDRGTLRFDEGQVAAAGYEVGRTLTCTWSAVVRGGPLEENDDTVTYGTEIPLDGPGATPDTDIIRVRCRNFAGIAVYDVVHAHIRDTQLKPDPATSGDPVNVLIFGVDSLSRLAFMRLLPRTFEYLTRDLRMRVFRGMNKVADNTFPNLVAMLTGQAAYGGRLPSESEGFDGWPLIWKNFSAAGYATLWAEDFPDFGLFNYLAKGFRRSPALHYLRPFWLALDESSLLKSSSHMCYGDTPKHLLQMDYVRRFLKQYGSLEKVPFFGFSFLAELSHEYISWTSAADQDFVDFFRFLEEEGHLRNTLVVVMSDHGHRFDHIRRTQVGHIEERMPFFVMHIPEKLLSKHPDVVKRLETNQGRLVTHYDTHATLLDILDHVTRGTELGRTTDRGTLGLSLFGPIGGNRSCSEASIPVNFCTCESESPLAADDPQAERAAQAVVEHLNRMLEGRELCALLGVGQLKSAYLVRTPEDRESNFLTKVRVVLVARPSQGMFEATVQLDGSMAAVVLGDVSRINPYEGQSDCIEHATLRKFCFCIDPVDERDRKL